jgi:hypothetical protein
MPSFMRHFLIPYDGFTKLKWQWAITAELTFTLGVRLIQGDTFSIMTSFYHHNHNILNTEEISIFTQSENFKTIITVTFD